MKMSIPAILDVVDLVEALDGEQPMQVILAIDERQADTGFTEGVIVTLIKAMKKEFVNHPDELKEFKSVVLKALE
jgi:hypothetical protein